MITKSFKILVLLFLGLVSALPGLWAQAEDENNSDLIFSLCNRGNRLLDSLPEQSLEIFDSAIKLADSTGNTRGKVRAFFSLANYHLLSGNPGRAKAYYDSITLLTTPDDDFNRMRILIGYGEFYYETLSYDSALFFLVKAEHLATKIHDTLYLSAIYNNFAKTNDKLGKRDNAITYYLKAAEMFTILDDKKDLAVAYNNIATLNLSFKNYPEALHYFLIALELTIENGSRKDLAMIYSNIGVAYYNSDSLDKAELYHKKSLHVIRKSGSAFEKARGYMNLANLYSNQKLFDKAISYYDSSLRLCIDNEIEYGILLNKINLGQLNYNLGNYWKAAEYMENALKLIAAYSLPEEETELYLMLYKTYVKLGNESLALKNFEKHHILRDSIAGEKRNEMLLELQAKYENEKKQKELVELQKEKLTNEIKYRIIVIVFLIALLILISFLFFIFYRQRRAVYLKNLAEKNKVILESMLTTKDKELANFAMQLARNYETSAEVSTEIKDILPLSNKAKNDRLEKLVHNLDNDSNTNAWKEFEVRFEQVHKEFFYVLKELHPELTPVELKVCSLLRLNMSSKDISALTNRSVRTIENTRTSIRKKLNLNPQTSLTSYLLSI